LIREAASGKAFTADITLDAVNDFEVLLPVFVLALWSF